MRLESLVDTKQNYELEGIEEPLGGFMARVAKKGSCGGTPRVGKKGDPKPARGGRGRGTGRGRRSK